MAIRADFGDSVVVTTATTRVDTEALVRAAQDCSWARDEAWQAVADVDEAISRVGIHLGLVPVSGALALQALEQSRAEIVEVAQYLTHVADALICAALVYVGAEGQAQRFDEVWRALRPESLSAWSAGALSIHNEFLMDLVPRSVGIPAPIAFAPLGAGLQPWDLALTVGTAWGHSRDFGSNRGEATQLFRAQIDVEAAAARLLHASRLSAAVGLLRPADESSWWGASQGNAQIASGLAASWALGTRSVLRGSSRGLQVTTLTATDTLDMRTGAPWGYRQAHSVLPPDLRTASGAHLAAASLGILMPATALSALTTAAALGSVPSPTSTPVGRPPHRVLSSTAPSAMLDRITDLASSPDHGQIEVLRHDTPGGAGVHTSWSVIIRGTQVWSVGGANPQDLLTNFQAASGAHSDQARAVVRAMELAGISPGEPIELIGHSQGGIIAGQLASIEALSNEFAITSVLTAGSPTAGAHPVEGVAMLNLENTADLVPGLDGAPNRDGRGSVTVFFDGTRLDAFGQDGQGAGPHDQATYVAAMHWLEESGGAWGTGDVSTWLRRRDQALALGSATQTTSMLFDTRRL